MTDRPNRHGFCAHDARTSGMGMKQHESIGTKPPIVEKLLTYKQAGELLGVTERTVWTLVADGALQAVRFGRSVRIDPADLRGYIDRCKSAAPGARTAPRNGGKQ